MSGSDHVSIDLSLTSNREAPAVARRFVAEHAEDLPAEMIDDATLLVSELVTNAVIHGRPDITVRLRLDPPRIGVAVDDDGDLFATDRPAADATQAHGRGLLIVAATARAWGVEAASPPPGKTVWFELAATDYT